MKILYLTQWFNPEPAFKGADFAAAIVARGHDVEVVTAFPNYPGGKVYPGYRIRPYARETLRGLTVHRLCIFPSHNRSTIGRVANYLSFFVSALIFGLWRGRRYDAIYVYHPPITPGLAAALFCMVHRKPMVIEIQDLWPDSVVASGMAGGRVDIVLRWLCNFVYRRAQHIIPQSDGMRGQLIARGVPPEKLTRIFNWSTYQPIAIGDESIGEVALLPTFVGRFNAVYGGNLGQAQGLATVIRAVAEARHSCPSLHLHLFGHGIETEMLEALAGQIASDGVTFHGLVGRAAMDRIFDQADVLVLHLKDDPLYDITLPSKMQHYLSCGKPIIAGLKGEAGALLLQSGAARVCPPEDAARIAAAMIDLTHMSPGDRAELGRNGRRFYEAHMAFDSAVDATVAVIENAAHPCTRQE